VCTLCQFIYGVFDAFVNSKKRKLLLNPSHWRLPLKWHMLFSLMFFAGPFFSNLSTIITQKDFYPVRLARTTTLPFPNPARTHFMTASQVFLVVRSCGSVSSMALGWLFAGKTYTIRQVVAVVIITAGAGVTTLGCYNGSQVVENRFRSYERKFRLLNRNQSKNANESTCSPRRRKPHLTVQTLPPPPAHPCSSRGSASSS